MSYVTCHCTHSKDSHETGQLSCTLCECTLYRPNTADDPFKNSVQQKTVRLLALARESDYPKTRKLGARIEEMLGELELISEQEQIYKAEQARYEQERLKAEKNLQEARALLAQAEEEAAKFNPAPRTRKKESTTRRSPTFNPESEKLIPCEICGKEIRKRSMGVHKFSAHGIRKEEK